MKKTHTLLFLILLTIVLFTGCSQNTTPITETDFCMNTYISITVYGEKDAKLIDEAFSLCHEYDELLSRTSETGDLAKIENNRKSLVEVSEHTVNIIKIYKDLYETSEYMLDCTVGELTDLWNFSENTDTIPSENDILTAIDTIRLDDLQVNDNQAILLSDFATLDFGAVAKGYIADQIKQFLIDEGVKSAILNFGGNVTTIGSRPDGEKFNIGIQLPFAETEEVITSVQVEDMAVVTAGIYERYIESNGVIYHHILNPFTGYSVESDLLSATIICEDAALGDAYSTICILLGKDKALELINNTDGIEAILIDENQDLIFSDNASDYIN